MAAGVGEPDRVVWRYGTQRGVGRKTLDGAFRSTVPLILVPTAAKNPLAWFCRLRRLGHHGDNFVPVRHVSGVPKSKQPVLVQISPRSLDGDIPPQPIPPMSARLAEEVAKRRRRKDRSTQVRDVTKASVLPVVLGVPSQPFILKLQEACGRFANGNWFLDKPQNCMLIRETCQNRIRRLEM